MLPLNLPPTQQRWLLMLVVVVAAMVTFSFARDNGRSFGDSIDGRDLGRKVLMTLIEVPISTDLINGLLQCLERVDAPPEVMEAMESLAEEAERLNGEINGDVFDS
ncbi:hypothetical protein Pcinc_033355 [Petrolisthes cinctipes]|uniref:Uncharacterized protein n=1 Tax=Petrolisthes cinctipes TaxID=88211 RepID=A0AAE1ESE3_PETCI|nr:hypothetical protein Pcinc_033355 [Petrolisthes cinctipes]